MGSRRVSGVAITLAVGLAGCGTASMNPYADERPTLRVAGERTLLSAFFDSPKFSAKEVDLGDSANRLIALQQDSLDAAVAVADVAYLAYNGRLTDKPQPLDKIRAIALLHPAVVNLVVRSAADVHHGLRGVRVILGNSTGANASFGERLIASMGIGESQIRAGYLHEDQAVDKLLNGDIDAAFVIGRQPQESVARALRGGARLVDIDDQVIERLRVYYPLLTKTLIPRGTYPSQPNPVHTVGVDLLLVCRADLDKDLVYEMTRVYFEQGPESGRTQADSLRASAAVIPLHAGAARYYREREVSR